jgi:2,4-dienoyl-CoA reductase-like NADH-dependent reductase (Old Yellow Enzyme family)
MHWMKVHLVNRKPNQLKIERIDRFYASVCRRSDSDGVDQIAHRFFATARAQKRFGLWVVEATFSRSLPRFARDRCGLKADRRAAGIRGVVDAFATAGELW